MSGHIGNVVYFVFVLITSGHVTGQTHDVAQLNRKLTIMDMRLEIMELKTIVEKMVVGQKNASDGSNTGQGNTGVNQKEIADLKNKLKAHEDRLNRVFITVNEIQEENAARKRTAIADIETTCNDRFNALQKEFKETAAMMMTGFKKLKKHVDVKGSVVDQMHKLVQSVISEQNKRSDGIDKADVRQVGEANKLDKCCTDCGDPTPDHGTVNTTATTYGTVVKVSCNHGYVLSGTSIIKCNADSVWSESATCYPYDCGSAAPANGVATAPSGTTYQQQATVQCNPGYTLNGSSVIECNSTGWNDSLSCVIERQKLISANGYRVKPIFGSDLEKDIKIGTRVVRGADWKWDEQDDGGPGTVTWVYSNSKIVEVKWDKGGATTAIASALPANTICSF